MTLESNFYRQYKETAFRRIIIIPIVVRRGTDWRNQDTVQYIDRDFAASMNRKKEGTAEESLVLISAFPISTPKY